MTGIGIGIAHFVRVCSRLLRLRVWYDMGMELVFREWSWDRNAKENRDKRLGAGKMVTTTVWTGRKGKYDVCDV